MELPMTVLCDYTLLVLEKDPITKKLPGTYPQPFQIHKGLGKAFMLPFNTAGMHHAHAVISMMVKGIVKSSKGARVAIHSSVTGENDIGRLDRTSTANASLWRHEQFTVPTNILSSKSDGTPNTLIIGRAELGGGEYEPFEVRDIVCLFKQSDT
jgi:hypothetical protein